jgi:hypothetical protein
VPDSASANRRAVEQFATVGLVLECYKAAMARSRNERDAFEVAVRLYRAHSSGVREAEARHEVAKIICGTQNEGPEELAI